MDWAESIREAIRYIEANLREELTISLAGNRPREELERLRDRLELALDSDAQEA